MILSVVIVSYQVKFFLEQCLSSVKKAVEGTPVLNGLTEVFVVDNAPEDGSLDFLRPLYPGFHFIQNGTNTGFAKANNQALTLCKGEYILFLNPDTILAEDSLQNCISFFRKNPGAGALGIQMVDGSGQYLHESKRGFPGPSAAFYKMTGLARLFPRSKIFSSYYLGHLPENSSHSVDILSGAFMMVKKTVLDKTGGFDEQFFMYGEDIDLSYRILQAGYQNYYIADSLIIHFKGESTIKDSKYIHRFYRAMKLFLKKHRSPGGSSFQWFLVHTGMRIHQMLAYLRLPFRRWFQSATTYPTYILGSPEQKKKWAGVLQDKKIPLAENKNQAEQIIYCEGDAATWKSIIREIRENKNRCFYLFHGSGTHAAVGSHFSQKKGWIIELYS